MEKKSMIYGLVGEKLGHSYSKCIHEKLGEYQYELFPLSKAELDIFLNNRQFSGLNVTIPYKQTVMPYCEYIDPLAQEIGAVNTLYFNDAGQLCGANTDYAGFLYAMEQAKIRLHGQKVLILGDGATSKTICKAVLDQDPQEILIASRKISAPAAEKQLPLRGAEGIKCTEISYDSFALYKNAEIIINTTPVGMWPNVDGEIINLDVFPSCIGVFDVVYNPYCTKLIQKAKERGIPYASGLSMLVAQATAAAAYFTGKPEFSAQNETIIQELRAAL